MADEKLFDDDAPDKGADSADSDSGLGNLPPLSDFDSQGEADPDDALPPLGDFGSPDTNGAGNDDQPPARQNGASGASSGFQDLAADSDFSPETPDIGPGPDASLDTPIFDSAFGGADSGFGDLDSGFGGVQKDAAAQAGDSPMFEDFGGDDDFAVPGGGAAPAPDFSADAGFGDIGGDFGGAGIGAPVGAGIGAPPAAPPGPPVKVKRGGVSPIVVIVFGLIALVIGIVTSPFLSDYLTFLPNPLAAQVAEKDQAIARQQQQIRDLMAIPTPGDGGVVVSEERLAQLSREILEKENALSSVQQQLSSNTNELEQKQRELGTVERELRERNDEIISAREFLEELRNETAIVQARQRGLIAEVDRLTGLVGELEEANLRSVATKEALAHNVDRLIIQVKESIPLTPQKFEYAQRLAAVRQLRDKVEHAPWVTPELQNEYTSYYLRELELARANEYFFAKISVTDRFGHRSQKWAECLMRGNWAVYYRTLDGANIGSFENIGTTDVPVWGYREDMAQDVQKAIEAYIVNARIPDFESQVQLLAERELAGQEGTAWQRAYGSL